MCCTPAWGPSQVKGFIGLSGAYDVFELADHLDRRGLYKSMFGRIMSIDNQPAFQMLSPHYALQKGHVKSQVRPVAYVQQWVSLRFVACAASCTFQDASVGTLLSMPQSGRNRCAYGGSRINVLHPCAFQTQKSVALSLVPA